MANFGPLFARNTINRKTRNLSYKMQLFFGSYEIIIDKNLEGSIHGHMGCTGGKGGPGGGGALPLKNITNPLALKSPPAPAAAPPHPPLKISSMILYICILYIFQLKY
jgi:hypothetical protein